MPEELYDVAPRPRLPAQPDRRPGEPQQELDRLRGELEAWMKRTGDPLLESFQKRDDPAVREAYVKKQEKESADRRAEAGKPGGRRRNRAAEAEAEE